MEIAQEKFTQNEIKGSHIKHSILYLASIILQTSAWASAWIRRGSIYPQLHGNILNLGELQEQAERGQIGAVVGLGNNWVKDGIRFHRRFPFMALRPVPNKLSSGSKDVAVATALLVSRLETPWILSSGRTAGSENISEALAMLGYISTISSIPRVETPHLEEDSFSTLSNAQEIKRIAQENGWQRIVVVTTPAHRFRTAYIFHKVGISGVQIITADTILQHFDFNTEPATFWASMREIIKETLLLTFTPQGKLFEKGARSRTD